MSIAFRNTDVLCLTASALFDVRLHIEVCKEEDE